MTLQEFVTNEYEVWRCANRKNGKADLRRLKVNFVKRFGEKLLTEITPILIERWRTDRINSGICLSTLNRDIVILKSTLAKAVEWDLIKEHPLKHLKLHKIDLFGKVRYLHPEEENRLEAALQRRDAGLKFARMRANEWRAQRRYNLLPDLTQFVFADHITPMILVTLNTGLRQGELFNLQWEDINFDRAVLTVRGDVAKSGKTRSH